MHAGLQRLGLPHNRFDRLPWELAAATNLRCLDLLRNYDLALTVDDVDSILGRMPHLTDLRLGFSQTPAPVLWHLCRRMPQLNISDKDSWEEQDDD